MCHVDAYDAATIVDHNARESYCDGFPAKTRESRREREKERVHLFIQHPPPSNYYYYYYYYYYYCYYYYYYYYYYARHARGACSVKLCYTAFSVL